MASAKRKSALTQFNELAKAFRKKEFEPLYLWYGDESYFIDELQKLAVKHALDDDFRDFNYDLLYGDEIAAGSALAICMTFPTMDKRRLVIVRRFDRMKEKRLWAAYAKRFNPQATVLLISQRRPDFRSEPFKSLRAAGKATEFAPLTRWEIPRFIRSRLRDAGRTIEKDAVECLADYVGASLRFITGELDKLQLFAGDRAHLTKDDVVLAIGQSREVNAWELRDAMVKGRLADAERLATRCLDRSVNPAGEAIRIVAMLGTYFTKVWQVKSLLGKKRQSSYGAIKQVIKGHDFMVRQYMDVARLYSSAGVREVFGALTAADCELKGESPRDTRLILTLMMHRIHQSSLRAHRGTVGYRS